MRRISLYALVPCALAPMLLASPPTAGAQDRAVTLADAIRLAERIQPGMVQARSDIDDGRGAEAQRLGGVSPFLQRRARPPASSFPKEPPESIRSPARS